MDQIALVDSGCSSSIVSGMLCRPEVWKSTAILTAGRKCLLNHGVGSITLTVTNRNPLKTNVRVVNSKPLGFDLLLRMDVIKKLGGVHINEGGKAHFTEAAHTLSATIELEQPDFHTKFDQCTKSWTVSCKWSGDQPPEKLYSRVPEYTITARANAEYDEELQNWIDNAWLVPYPEDKLGPPKGLIPLMAVIQQNKQKVRLVLDYRELNDHVDPFTARADICTKKLREWRRAGSNVSMLDLRKAYLQVHLHQSLWSYQTVLFKGRRYCLTRMGFGLNVAPSIMQTIVDAILMKDKRIQRATSAYIDDVYVDENIVSAARVTEHLYSFGFLSKESERLQDGVRVLGLQVWEEDNSLYWRRGNKIPDMTCVVTRRNAFSQCGKLVRHLPVGGWLCVAVAFIKRRASDITAGWYVKIDSAPLNTMIKEVLTRVHKEDLAWGRWCVDGQALSVWVDISSLATGVSLVFDGAVVEDTCWLRPEKDSQHINLTELDAIIKGINLAILWKTTTLHLFTDSACVHKWISDTLTGKAKVQTKPASEMHIHRRLGTIIKLVKEYVLSMNVSLVKSSQIRQIDWLKCLRGGLMQLKGTLGLCNLPALRPWAQLGLTRSRLFTDKAVILVCGGHFILWKRLPRGLKGRSENRHQRMCRVSVDRSSTCALVKGGFEC